MIHNYSKATEKGSKSKISLVSNFQIFFVLHLEVEGRKGKKEEEKKEKKRTLQLACRRQPEEGRRPRELTAPTEPHDSVDWSAKFREEKKERRKANRRDQKDRREKEKKREKEKEDLHTAHSE